MAKKAMNAGQMSAAQLAAEACDQGFRAGVEKMVEILLQGWVLGTTLEWIFGRVGPLLSAATPPDPMPQPHGNTDYEG